MCIISIVFSFMHTHKHACIPIYMYISRFDFVPLNYVFKVSSTGPGSGKMQFIAGPLICSSVLNLTGRKA